MTGDENLKADVAILAFNRLFYTELYVRVTEGEHYTALRSISK